MEDAGKKCILINLPGSSPPRIKGVVLSSFLTPGESYISPKGLVEKYPPLAKYRVVPNFSLKFAGDDEAFIKDVREMAYDRFDAARMMMKRERWDFFFVLFTFSDTFQHSYYQRILDDIKAGKQTDLLETYRDFDRYLGRFAKDFPKVNFMLVSDHGFGKVKHTFFINKWLESEGYLKTKSCLTGGNLENTMTFNYLLKSRPTDIKTRILSLVFKALAKIPFALPVAGLVLRAVLSAAPRYKKIVLLRQLANIGLQPNLKQTVAYSLPGTRREIYINLKAKFSDGVVEDKDYKKKRAEIVNKLRKLTTPDGNKVFERVQFKEEVYSGHCLNEAPDILLECANVVVNSELFASAPVVKALGSWHNMEGIFLAWGPDIKKASKKVSARLIDIAPTALALVGLGTDQNMDGVVLKNILKPAFRISPLRRMRKKVGPKPAGGDPKSKDEEIVKERLKQLGYL
jgi:predicted AlkP superfamily phosphohydrolase/phosphomutase